jgi:hypothetical protein
MNIAIVLFAMARPLHFPEPAAYFRASRWRRLSLPARPAFAAELMRSMKRTPFK